VSSLQPHIAAPSALSISSFVAANGIVISIFHHSSIVISWLPTPKASTFPETSAATSVSNIFLVTAESLFNPKTNPFA
jgi:hypothetical protein